jgi:hypothetical protein
MNTQESMFATDTPQMSMFSTESQSEVTALFNESGQIVVIFSAVLDKRQIRRFGYSPAAYLPQIKSMVQTWENIPSGHTGVAFTLKSTAARDAFTLRGIIATYAREWIAALMPDAEQPSLF